MNGVDASVLNRTNAVIYFRFKPEGIVGVKSLLELHDSRFLELELADNLRDVLMAGEWAGRSRAGRFTNKLAGPQNREYQEYFLKKVVPHLEILRSA